MGNDLFDAGADPVGPVGGGHDARDVDPLLLGIFRNEFGKQSQVFADQVDVEEASAVVAVPEDFAPLRFGQMRRIVPPFLLCEALRLFSAIAPPEGEGLRIVCRYGCHANWIIMKWIDKLLPNFLPAHDFGPADAHA